MGDANITPGPQATIAVHEALIRQLVNGQERIVDTLVGIRTSLAGGEQRFTDMERRQRDCDARHDSDEMQALRSLPATLAVVESQLATIRLVVYGGVGVSLVGLLTTAGVVIVKVLGMR